MTLPPDGPTAARPVLVTGASGFIGEHLTRRLVRSGHVAAGEVVGAWHTRPVEVPGARLQQLDLTDAAAVDRWIADTAPRAIVHTAAMTAVDQCRQDPDGARAAIVNATENLAAAAARHVPDAVFIVTSTDLVFDGDQAPYRVGDPPQPTSVYGRLKLAAEAPVLAMARGVVVRPALVYGAPTTHKGSFLGWMVAALRASRPLDLFEDEFRTPVWGDDLTAALAALCDGRAAGLFHAPGPARMNRVEMGRLVAAALGADPALLHAKKVADAPFPEPRPRDVSLDAGDFWRIVGHDPSPMADALQQIAPQLA